MTRFVFAFFFSVLILNVLSPNLFLKILGAHGFDCFVCLATDSIQIPELTTDT